MSTAPSPTPPQPILRDSFGRTHRYLRLSLTDRCNMRCVYCMPEEGLQWIAQDHLLSTAEILYLGRVFIDMGIEHIRLTGGEPTVRKDLLEIVEGLAGIDGLQDLSMTTNALLLGKMAIALRGAGLKRLNISIDSLQPTRFSTLTRGGSLERVLAGIDAAAEAGFGTPTEPIKLNAVLIPNQNEDELMDFIRFAQEHPATLEPRFIEYMPFTQRRLASSNHQSLKEQLSQQTPLIPVDKTGVHRQGPAQRYHLPAYGITVGFISPISNRFCSTCNRLRLSSEGDLRACLAKEPHPTLRDIIRSPHTRQDIEQAILLIVQGKVQGHQCATEDQKQIPFEGIMTRIGG